MLPDIGGLDISPIIAFFILLIIRDAVLGKFGEWLQLTFWL
jgi:uncharacterized protein YggT (Ycf19 family)